MKRNIRMNPGRSTWMILFLNLCNALMGQVEIPMESVRLITDREVYVAGEEVRIAASTLDAGSGESVHFSDILYLELLDEENSSRVQEKMEISGGESSGRFVLPADLASGYYLLRAYTAWMKNAGAQAFSRKQILVINPFEKKPSLHFPEQEDTAASVPLENFSGNASGKLNIRVEGAGKTYGRREKVHFRIHVSDPDGDPLAARLVLRVARNGLLRNASVESNQPAAEPVSSQALVYAPERGGHIIAGNISGRNGKGSFGGDTLLYSVVGKKALFDYCISDSSGNFRFLAQKLSGQKELVIQNLNPSRKDYRIRLNDPFSNEFTDTRLPGFSLDTSDLEDLNRAVITAQVNALYRGKKDLLPFDPGLLPFYANPMQETNLEDFLRLPEMSEVFFELVPNVQMRGSGDQTRIRTWDDVQQRFSIAPPLILVDGVVTWDQGQIAELDPRRVEKIELVNTVYNFGILQFPGILGIVTEDGQCPVDYPDYFLRQVYPFLSFSSSGSFPEYPDPADGSGPEPDYRNTLHWDPDVQTDANGMAEISFYSSDDSGEYILEVIGFSGKGLSGMFLDSIFLGPEGSR